MKTALITGASTGIGKELAIIHAKKKGNLVLVARSKDKLTTLKENLESEYGISAYVIAQDLFEPDAAIKVFKEIEKNAIIIDYLFNNAGFGDNNLFKDSNYKWNQQMIQLNITSLTDFCHVFVQDFIKRGVSGKIMNVASTAAFQAIPYFSVYAATKSYVLSFSEALAIELSKDNITVTALCPGPTRTEFAANAKMDLSMADSKLLPTGKEVAEYGYRKMMAGQTIAIHGAMNRIGAKSGKLFPRSFVSKTAGTIMKKAGGH